MILYLLIILIIASIIVAYILAKKIDTDYLPVLLLFQGSILLSLSIPIMSTWVSYAHNMAIIKEQNRIINVNELQRDHLIKVLSNFNYNNLNTGTKFNLDTPVNSIVTELSAVEKSLREAHDLINRSYIYVQSVKLGPMSGITIFVGENKDD